MIAKILLLVSAVLVLSNQCWGAVEANVNANVGTQMATVGTALQGDFGGVLLNNNLIGRLSAITATLDKSLSPVIGSIVGPLISFLPIVVAGIIDLVLNIAMGYYHTWKYAYMMLLNVN